ncbi:unnamed protein product [Ectocarpus sp. 13 AM-2016]
MVVVVMCLCCHATWSRRRTTGHLAVESTDARADVTPQEEAHTLLFFSFFLCDGAKLLFVAIECTATVRVMARGCVVFNSCRFFFVPRSRNTDGCHNTDTNSAVSFPTHPRCDDTEGCDTNHRPVWKCKDHLDTNVIVPMVRLFRSGVSGTTRWPCYGSTCRDPGAVRPISGILKKRPQALLVQGTAVCLQYRVRGTHVRMFQKRKKQTGSLLGIDKALVSIIVQPPC